MKIHSVFLCLALMLFTSAALAQNNPGYVPPSMKSAESVPVQQIPTSDLPIEQQQVQQQPQSVTMENTQSPQMPLAEPPIVDSDQTIQGNRVPSNVLLQYPFQSENAQYQLQKESDFFILELDLKPTKNPEYWRLKTVCNISFPLMDSQETCDPIYLDARGNLLQEDIRRQETTYQGPLKKVVKETINIASAISIKEEKNPILGNSKVIRFTDHNSGRTKESMIGVADTVTSGFQIFSWIATLRQLPSEGVVIRWCFEGRPLPVLVKSSLEANALVYTVYPAPNRTVTVNPNDFLFKFIYTSGRSQNPVSRFPDEAMLNLSGKYITVKRVR